eukprot:3199790-Amphidinium_carterae.1
MACPCRIWSWCKKICHAALQKACCIWSSGGVLKPYTPGGATQFTRIMPPHLRSQSNGQRQGIQPSWTLCAVAPRNEDVKPLTDCWPNTPRQHTTVARKAQAVFPKLQNVLKVHAETFAESLNPGTKWQGCKLGSAAEVYQAKTVARSNERGVHGQIDTSPHGEKRQAT